MGQLSSTAHNEDGYASPLYLQVQAALKEMIEDVEFGPGERIPSERELSERLGVSRMTIRRAIESLTQQGILERRSTSGTYVREPEVIRQFGSSSTMGLTQLLGQEGTVPGARLLSFQTLRAPRKIADHLKVRVGQLVIMVRRLRLADNQPFCIETSYLPQELVPGLAAADFVEGASLYGLLRDRYAIQIANTEQMLNISRAIPDEADLLGLDVDAPVLLLRATVSDASGRRIEYLKSVNHPDRVVFRTTAQFST